MHHGFALRYIAEVMGWSGVEEDHETAWLRLMSEFKYDSYQDFLAGSRFVEALLDWLQQFNPADRPLAYKLLRDRLIFINSPELQHLVRRAYPAHIRPRIEARAARQLNIPRYLLGSSAKHQAGVEEMSNRTLYVGLSDGARLDYFRRANVGFVNNEQIVASYQVADDKWKDVAGELKTRTNNPQAVFELIVLLDDFTASGTTLIDHHEGKWKGKLAKIADELEKHTEHLAIDYDVLIHHYIGTSKALDTINTRLAEVSKEPRFAPLFRGKPHASFDMMVPDEVLLRPGAWPELDCLLDRHYDPAIMTKPLKRGGPDVKHGFAACGLPLVIEHNVPNNSLALLWAESPSDSENPVHMRPLFRRRQRHL